MFINNFGTQILCEEISAAILSLLDMHSSKQRAQTKITERVLQENYAEVWKIVEEEIKKVKKKNHAEI